MVIDPNNIGSANAANAKSRPASTERAGTEPKTLNAAPSKKAGDTVSLSPEAQSITKIETAIANSPDVDSDKVSAVRSALQSGQYTINADAIADRLLNQDGQL